MTEERTGRGPILTGGSITNYVPADGDWTIKPDKRWVPNDRAGDVGPYTRIARATIARSQRAQAQARRDPMPIIDPVDVEAGR